MEMGLSLCGKKIKEASLFFLFLLKYYASNLIISQTCRGAVMCFLLCNQPTQLLAPSHQAITIISFEYCFQTDVLQIHT